MDEHACSRFFFGVHLSSKVLHHARFFAPACVVQNLRGKVNSEGKSAKEMLICTITLAFLIVNLTHRFTHSSVQIILRFTPNLAMNLFTVHHQTMYNAVAKRFLGKIETCARKLPLRVDRKQSRQKQPVDSKETGRTTVCMRVCMYTDHDFVVG